MPFLMTETGGTVEIPRKSMKNKTQIISASISFSTNEIVSEEGPLRQTVSSIMTLNPQTQKYELPPPRWFNNDTGEYENIKPMYFLDPNDPSRGLVPTKVIQEDDA